MGSAVAAENNFEIILIVGTTHRMITKLHHGIRNMEGTVRKLDWQSLKTFQYCCEKQ